MVTPRTATTSGRAACACCSFWLGILEAERKEANDLLARLIASPDEIDTRLDYLELQVDRDDYEEARRRLRPGPDG